MIFFLLSVFQNNDNFETYSANIIIIVFMCLGMFIYTHFKWENKKKNCRTNHSTKTTKIVLIKHRDWGQQHKSEVKQRKLVGIYGNRGSVERTVVFDYLGQLWKFMIGSRLRVLRVWKNRKSLIIFNQEYEHLARDIHTFFYSKIKNDCCKTTHCVRRKNTEWIRPDFQTCHPISKFPSGGLWAA